MAERPSVDGFRMHFWGLTLRDFSHKIYQRNGDDENSTQGIISERNLFWWKDSVRELWNRPRSSA